MGWPWYWKNNPSKHVPEFLSTIHQVRATLIRISDCISDCFSLHLGLCRHLSQVSSLSRVSSPAPEFTLHQAMLRQKAML
jgi:hypothetical protein